MSLWMAVRGWVLAAGCGEGWDSMTPTLWVHPPPYAQAPRGFLTLSHVTKGLIAQLGGGGGGGMGRREPAIRRAAALECVFVDLPLSLQDGPQPGFCWRTT